MVEVWGEFFFSFSKKSSLRGICSLLPKLSEVHDKAPTDLALGFGSGRSLH